MRLDETWPFPPSGACWARRQLSILELDPIRTHISFCKARCDWVDTDGIVEKP